jgi:1,4-dihydroxy-2-naphthoate octaprenyltransferase
MFRNKIKENFFIISFTCCIVFFTNRGGFMSESKILKKPANPLMPWIMAMRPKTFGLFSIPMIVGTLLAPLSLNEIQWSLLLSSLCSGFFIQIGMHFVNDALDFKRGTDTHQRLGPIKVTQQGWLTATQVLNAGYLCFALAFMASIPMLFQGGISFLWIILASCLLGYFYTGGPFPVSYLGISEPLVLIFYGWVATAANYYLQTGMISNLSLLAGTQIGLLCTIMLAIGNLRDRATDAQSEKKTLAVRFGVTFARFETTSLALTPFLLTSIWLAEDYVWAASLPWFALPFAIILLKKIWTVSPGILYNSFFAFGVLLHISFGLLLAIGYRMSL